MTRHTATPSVVGYDISAVDADGVGRRLLSVMTFSRDVQSAEAEAAARLLTLALSLPGGIDAAAALLRAEMARQS